MNDSVRIPDAVWKQMIATVESRLAQGPLRQPIAFALYTKEDDRSEVIACRELPLVLTKGSSYPYGSYDYRWPGVTSAGFYVRPGSGRWFEGTWIFGDGLALDDEDVKWMQREMTPVRIKVDRDTAGSLQWKAYRLAPVEIQVEGPSAL